MGRFLLSLILVLLGSTAWADDTAVQGVGGTLQAMKGHPSVRMESMDVRVDMTTTRADVDCHFVFRNTGRARRVRMGFPESGWNVGRFDGFTRFHTWVDGHEVPAKIEGSGEGPEGQWTRWRVKRVDFARGQVRHVRVRYRMRLGLDDEGSRLFWYTVSSGASWKGPVGSARILLRLHKGGNGGDFEVGANDEPRRFRRVGRNTFVWSARRLDPDSQDDVCVTYQPPYAHVSIADTELERVQLVPGRSHISGGVHWIALRSLAEWFDAELTYRHGEATLTKGRRQVAVRADRPVLTANGRRLSLPRAPRLKEGRLLVPLAQAARALGASTTFDSRNHLTRVTIPARADLEATDLGPGLDAAYVWAALPEGWAPPEIGDYDHSVRAQFSKLGGPPWLCRGDFNGDGAADAVVFVVRGDRSGLYLLPGIGPPPSVAVGESQWLPGSPARSVFGAGRLPTLVRTRPPGEVAYYEPGETTPKSGRLQLRHDAIEIIAWGKAAVLYYWDNAGKQFRWVVSAD